MDVSLFIRQRLRELGLEQKELAKAVQVTDSYISQLLAQKKSPPAPARTDLYERIGQFLRLPSGKLEGLAQEQRHRDLKRKVLDVPRPLFKDFRELLLRKCVPARQTEVRRIFEKDAFGEVERLVTQKVLETAQGLARQELRSEAWIKSAAAHQNCSYEQMRVAVLEFLDTDVLRVSSANCDTFLDPMIQAWDIDLGTFGLEVVVNPRITGGGCRKFEFVERPTVPPVEPGLEQFLNNAALSGDTTEEELEFLRQLRFVGRRPTALYYYRELQSLRDPLHFTATGGS